MTICAPRRASAASAASAASKRARGLCCTPFCRRGAAHHRLICNTCRDRAWRARYPELHLYKNLKASAKRREIDFTLTLEEWVTFCAITGFVTSVGRGPECATVDRIYSDQGYSAGNIRVLSHQANSEKKDAPPDVDLAAVQGTPVPYREEENPLRC